MAQHKERCGQLEARSLSAETGASAKAAELQAVEEERGQLAHRLAAAEASASGKAEALQEAQGEMSKLEQCVTAAQAEAAESQDALRKVQTEKCECEERCKQLESRLAEDPAGSNMELKTLLIENAKYEERCEQLKQQLGKAEAKLDQMATCQLETATYKERCRQLERQLTKSEEQARRLSGRFSAQPIDEHSSVCSEASWVHLSDAGSAATPLLAESASSGISVDTSGPHCFMVDATFKAESGILVAAEDLHQGSKILAADGSVVTVAASPKQHEAVYRDSSGRIL